MGATRWSSLVAYRQDVEAAFEQARREAWVDGDFELDGELFLGEEDSFDEDFDEVGGEDFDGARAMFEAAIGEHPGDEEEWSEHIDTLRAICGDEGTHSILDMERVASEPGFATLLLLDEEAIERAYGTAHPTLEQVEAGAIAYERWQGIAVPLFEEGGDVPTRWYFEGCSGD